MQPAMHLDHDQMEETARRALAEDLGEAGDITSKRIVRIDQPGRAEIVAKSPGILAGIPMAETVFKVVDRSLQIDWTVSDRATVKKGTVIGAISGRARAILAAERVALNFLQHMSGVATTTAAFVEVCGPYNVAVLCTRKTVPGIRFLQRYAVAAGGGKLHRAGLYDAVLIKTNHQKLSGGITEALKRTKANPNLQVEVEVADIKELKEALEAGADKILLDNATLPTIEKAVELTKGRCFLEVSGGITIDTVEEIAKAGPDAVSVGSLTHSAPAMDIALRMLGPVGAGPR